MLRRYIAPRGRGPLSLGPLLCISEGWISAVRKELCRTPMIQGNRPPLPLGGLFSQRASGIATAREQPPGLPRRLAGWCAKRRNFLFTGEEPMTSNRVTSSPSTLCEISHGGLGILGCISVTAKKKRKQREKEKRRKDYPGGAETTDPQRDLAHPPNRSPAFGTGGI